MMQVFRNLKEIPTDYGSTIVSVGNFDGVHCAHRRVIGEMVRRARELQARSVVVSFEPHPVRILRPGSSLKLLTPTPEKLRLLEQAGLDATLLLPFDDSLSRLSAEEFAQSVLQDGLKIREIHEGYNFRFGHKAAGNIDTLTQFGREMGFAVKAYPEMRLRGELVSSSQVRKLLSEGQVSRARHLLARPFSILSGPAAGRGYGSKYAVPTINLQRYDELVPGNGVYVTRTRVGEEWFDSVTNAGNRPTFGEDSFAIESHLLNFHPVDLFAGTEVEIAFMHRLRDEKKFASPEDLREQIGRDVRLAQRYFRMLQANKATSHFS